MADNLNTPVPSGAAIATDEIGGVHFPRSKMVWGADGTANDVSNSNPMPIAAPNPLNVNTNTAVQAFTIVPSDSAALTVQPYGIYVGTGGDVTLRAVGSTVDVTYKNLPDASYIAVRASHVRATGTTATDLIGEA